MNRTRRRKAKARRRRRRLRIVPPWLDAWPMAWLTPSGTNGPTWRVAFVPWVDNSPKARR